MDRTWLEPKLRWTARILGTLIATFLVLALTAGPILSALGFDVSTEESLTSEDLTVPWYELAALGTFAVGCLGFILAWWRPIEGGAIAVAGTVLPMVTSFTRGGFVFILIAMLGVAHIVDGVWRRRGIGPPVGRVRARPGAS